MQLIPPAREIVNGNIDIHALVRKSYLTKTHSAMSHIVLVEDYMHQNMYPYVS